MTVLKVNPNLEKEQVFDLVEKYLTESGFEISSKDFERPWGGFFVINENQIREFQKMFFPQVTLSEVQFSRKLSPKFLLVAPGARLSWQYHHRRAELWNLVAGKAAISRSMNDTQGPVEKLEIGDLISLQKGERHRLIGSDSWGVVAEIWMHSDPEHPSDESDIVRLADDYARK
ncbi:phosphoheptose isomerase [Algoriphagus sp. AK58]|uniref:phosphoheptose isomerase n=1 Tax=Algoriphagus sp. AK58 TaxID=1406877 RepID=UPI00164EF52A|nr:phosphoheptose isomerase [Algoriphagus sp. AK58]MBC6368616.1 phosphoheptose isomerase [Algoriphagus sp. AK58]